MNTETKIALTLIVSFGAGLLLVAVGLGFSPKLTSFFLGLILCFASVKLMSSTSGGGR